MRRQSPVEIIELLAAGGADGHGQRQIITFGRRPHFHFASVKCRIMKAHQIDHRLCERVLCDTHDFYWEVTRVGDQTLVGMIHALMRKQQSYRIIGAAEDGGYIDLIQCLQGQFADDFSISEDFDLAHWRVLCNGCDQRVGAFYH